MEKHFIDGNYLLHRSIHKGQNLTYNGVFTGGAYLFLKSLLSFTKDLTNTIIVFDGGHSKRRKELLESYKVKEKKKDYEDFREKFFVSLKILKEIFNHINIITIQAKGIEADDIIYLLSKNRNSIVHTDDEDYLQLLNYGVKIHRPMKGEFYSSVEDFKEKFGYHPKYLTLKKAIMGDSSDSIPGIKGIGDKKATKIVKMLDEKGLEPFVDNLKIVATYLKPSDRRLLITNLHIIERNLKLIDFKYVDITMSDIVNYIHQGKENEFKLVKTLQKYGFKSLISQFVEV